VFVKVCFLGEALAAARVVAQVGALVGVDHQMIKKIVPLLKYFSATVIEADKNS